jgi:WD40 repeat protein
MGLFMSRRKWVMSGVLVVILVLGLLAAIASMHLIAQKPARMLQGDDNVTIVAWSPDGTQLASAYQNCGALSIWNAASGQQEKTLDDDICVWELAWSSDSSLLAVAEFNDAPATLWNVHTGEKVDSIDDRHWINSIAWSPDGTELASVSERNRSILLWDLASGKQLYSLEGHTKAYVEIAWSPDGSQLVSGSYDGKALIWDAKNGRLLQSTTIPHFPIAKITWSPDGSWLSAISLLSDQIILWHPFLEGDFVTLNTHSEDSLVISMAWSPNGKYLASGTTGTISSGGSIVIWDTDTLTEAGRLQHPAGNPVSLAWSPDGRYLASATGSALITIWNMERWR